MQIIIQCHAVARSTPAQPLIWRHLSSFDPDPCCSNWQQLCQFQANHPKNATKHPVCIVQFWFLFTDLVLAWFSVTKIQLFRKRPERFEKISNLFWRYWVKTADSCFVKTSGRYFPTFWPSHNISTLQVSIPALQMALKITALCSLQINLFKTIPNKFHSNVFMIYIGTYVLVSGNWQISIYLGKYPINFILMYLRFL